MSEATIQEKILDYLLTIDSPKTVVQIAKAINEGNGAVEYHLQRFVEKSTLRVLDPPPSSTMRVYGKKYVLNPDLDLKRGQSRIVTLLFLTMMTTIPGVVLILVNPLYASLMLTPSAITGFAFTVRERSRQRKDLLRRLLTCS